ncbi:MAG: hypothetical protein JXA15_01860 [Spirochaetales bacterium]|nr:hypothetical protein [Spirochaetales bacterium]
MSPDQGKVAAKGRTLRQEVQFLAVAVPTAILALVVLAFIALVSVSIARELKADAANAADETRDLLADPLYRIDDEQARAIGEALLSSGRIDGIRLESPVSGIVLEVEPSGPSTIESLGRRIERDGLAVGSVTLHFSDRRLEETRKLLAGLGVAVILSASLANALALSLILARQIGRTLRGLASGVGAIARGDYERPVPLTRYRDVNQVVALLNDMAGRVEAKNRELIHANATLETRVAERTSELSDSLSELKRTQRLLVDAEKLSALGHLSAGVAHELNTPLGAIVSALGSIRTYFGKQALGLVRYRGELAPEAAALFDAALEAGLSGDADLAAGSAARSGLKRLKAELAKLGVDDGAELAASLHELGGEAALERFKELLGVPGAASVLEAALQPVNAKRMAEVAALAAQKASEVVAALKPYLDDSALPELGPVDVAKGFEEALSLMSEFALSRITVSRDCAAVHARGKREDLMRIWYNLIRNAVQAMAYQGELGLSARVEDGMAVARVRDNGPGIPEEIRDRVFEPFFTTKPGGEGLGLGLMVARRIAEGFGGSVEFESRPGYTEFTVRLPAWN